MEEVRGLRSKGGRAWIIQAVILVGLLSVVTPLTSSEDKKFRSLYKTWNKTYVNYIPCCGSIPMHTGPDGEFTKSLNKLRDFTAKINSVGRNRVDLLEENLGAQGAIFTKVAMGVVAIQVLLGIVVCCALRRCAGRSVDRRGDLVRRQRITVQIGSGSVHTQRPPQSAPVWSAYQDTQQSLVTVTCHRPAEPTAHLLSAPQGNDPSGNDLFVSQDKTQHEK
ncbi:hypothetical protein ACEWY4_002972 [Coilia grayii]|uniref:Uncharacterized protein n=1 Tax=Coilia grayii TaxID=363190 RepID=A0ABD1KQD6_9TELE